MHGGSADLTRVAAIYATCLAFALTFLSAMFWDVSVMTALFRAVLVAIVVRFLSPSLIQPPISAILDAAARDQVAAEASHKESDD